MIHQSDCGIYNEPAYPNTCCTCGANRMVEHRLLTVEETIETLGAEPSSYMADYYRQEMHILNKVKKAQDAKTLKEAGECLDAVFCSVWDMNDSRYLPVVDTISAFLRGEMPGDERGEKQCI